MNRCVLLVLMVIASGCIRSEGAAGKVTGMVTYKGQPVAAARLLFFDSLGHPVATDVMIDGAYSIQACLGRNAVTVHARDPDVADSGSARGAQPGKSRIPERYESSQTSGLSVDIKRGTNQFDIELTD